MNPLTAVALRDGALEALGAHGDPRSRDVLARALIAIDHNAERWVASEGVVHAHRVTLGVDARTLARLDHPPAVRDAVEAALAAAIARRPGEALLDVRPYWALEDAAEAEGYRGGGQGTPVARDDAEVVGRALVAYLRAAGEEAVAERMARGSVELSRTRECVRATLLLAREDDRALAADPHGRTVVGDALRALLQGPERCAVRVERRSA